MGQNTIVRSVNPTSVFESAKSVIDATVDIEQGDLVVFDGTANLLKKAAAEAEGATFLGVMQVSIVDGKLKSPYSTDTLAAQSISDIPGPVCGVVAKCVAKTADAFAPGDLVYLDPATGTRGVTTTGTKAIGVYQGPAIASAAAGQEVEIMLGHRFPGDVLVLP